VKAMLTILIGLLLAACESKPLGPVPLEGDDACASCRMVISERRYAGELVDSNGEIYKFDDVVCMLRFAHAHGLQQSSAKYFVMDYASGNHWIAATDAHFVRLRSSISSPMASGIVAFRDAQGVAYAAGQRDNPLGFAELWAKNLSETSADPTERAAGK